MGSIYNHDEKICMLQGITNGFATNRNPMSQLSNLKATIQKVIGDVKCFKVMLCLQKMIRVVLMRVIMMMKQNNV